jgi:hypothetical protein
VLAADIVTEEAGLDGLRVLRDEIAAISARYTDWLNHVERELGSWARR